MLIEISIGEALDRLTILELKMEKINDAKKLEEIQKDINTLFEAQKYKIEGEYYYKLLFYVNKEIWNLTDTIKQLHYTNSEFAKLTHIVFELNQSRFRVKNIINKIYESNINEQKSYNLTEIQFSINDSSLLDHPTLLNQLSYISLQYDILKISCSEAVKEHIIKNIPRFNYTFEEYSDKLTTIDHIDLLVSSITQ
jgi:hypothetical protein